jgi:hypothetical protein
VGTVMRAEKGGSLNGLIDLLERLVAWLRANVGPRVDRSAGTQKDSETNTVTETITTVQTPPQPLELKDACALGEFIEKEIPYAYADAEGDPEPMFLLSPAHGDDEVPMATTVIGGLTLPADPQYWELWRDGPASGYGDNQGKALHRTKAQAVAAGLTEADSEEAIDAIRPDTTRRWQFDKYAYRVTKSLMISYKIKDDNAPMALRDADGLVNRHILVGFVGIDPFG